MAGTHFKAGQSLSPSDGTSGATVGEPPLPQMIQLVSPRNKGQDPDGRCPASSPGGTPAHPA